MVEFLIEKYYIPQDTENIVKIAKTNKRKYLSVSEVSKKSLRFKKWPYSDGKVFYGSLKLPWYPYDSRPPSVGFFEINILRIPDFLSYFRKMSIIL